MDIGMYNILVLVGPEQSGKSTWASYFQKKVKNINTDLKVDIVTSEEDLLKSISFPTNTEFVVFDTCGFDYEQRERILALAKKNCYRTTVVLFEYKKQDFFISVDNKSRVEESVNVFNKKVVPELKRKKYTYNFSIKSKEKKFFQDLRVNILDIDMWEKTRINEENVSIIGDVHEHTKALSDIITVLPEGRLVFVGDLFDKGNNTHAMLSMAEDLLAKGALLVRGNHESFVARRLLGQVDRVAIEDQYFPSLKIFQKDSSLAARFLELYQQSLPFLLIKQKEREIYVTHAPCYNKYLGKLDEVSQKFQRNFYFSNREEDKMKGELRFISEEANMSHPFHVFGHVPNNYENIVDHNKMWLDTGAVYGNKLSAVIFKEGQDYELLSQPTTALTKGKLQM